MKTKLVTLLLVTLLLSVNTLQAKSKVLLRLNLKKGSTYEMTTVSDNNVDQDMMGQKLKILQKMTIVFDFQVLDLLPNKNFLIEYSMKQMKMDMDVSGQQINFDSESTDTDNEINMAIKGIKDLKLKFEISPEGKVERVEGIEEYIQKVSEKAVIKQSMFMFQNQDNFSSYIGQMFNYYPEEKVGKGDTWSSTFKLPGLMNMETKMDFELDELAKDQVVLLVTSDINMDSPIERGGITVDMKMKGTQKGTMTVNPNDGWLIGSELAQVFDMDMKMKNPQTGEDMEIPMKMDSNTRVSVVRK